VGSPLCYHLLLWRDLPPLDDDDGHDDHCGAREEARENETMVYPSVWQWPSSNREREIHFNKEKDEEATPKLYDAHEIFSPSFSLNRDSSISPATLSEIFLRVSFYPRLRR